MADEIKEFSRDEVFGTIFPGAPSPVTPTQQSAAAFTPAVSSAPVAPVTPPNLAMPSKSRAPVGMPDPTKLVETVSKANKALQEETAPPAPPSAIGGLVDQVISNWKPIAATAAATYAVTKAAPIISRGIGAAYNKATQKSPQQILEQTRIDPIFATEQEMTQAREASQKPGPTLTPLENLQQRANDLRAAVQAGNPAVPPQFGPAGTGANVPPAPPYMPSQTPGMPPTVADMDASFKAAQAAPVAPPEPIATPITAAPIDAPAATPTAGPNSPVTSIVNDTVKEMIQQTPDPVTGATSQPVAPPQELRTGTGKPAFAGMGQPAPLNKKGQPKFKNEYASVADVPSGYAFVPGAQYIDTPRQNIGQAEYTKAYTNRPFPLTNDLAIQESKDINKLLGRATRAELVAAGLPPAEITRGITQPINQPKGSGMGTKTVRVAGSVGALVAIPNVVNAAQQGNYGSAAVQAADVVTDYLPFIGQIKQALSPSSAGEGSTLTPEQMQYQQNAMLLGSPYAQTEIAKKRRQALEYAAKVGAGRGLTPASAYPR